VPFKPLRTNGRLKTTVALLVRIGIERLPDVAVGYALLAGLAAGATGPTNGCDDAWATAGAALGLSAALSAVTGFCADDQLLKDMTTTFRSSSKIPEIDIK